MRCGQDFEILWRYQALSLRFFSAAVLLSAISEAASAQVVNVWTNPASAHWEDPYWSLGALPAAAQTVAITNEGSKTVGIFPSTVANFPDSLNVTNLFISAPSNALSTVLLSYTGLDSPLHVVNDCAIGTNGSLVSLFGSLEIGGGTDDFDYRGLRIAGGNFVQEGGLTLANRTIVDGTMSLTNATLSLGPFNVGAFIGLDLSQSLVPGQVTQAGGTVSCAYLELFDASYTLAGGALYATNGLSGGTFNHLAGTNYADSLYVRRYTLSGGAIEGSILAGADLFAQSGGVVEVTNYVTVSDSSPGGNSGRPNYALTNGVVRCPYLYVGYNGVFHQYDGNISITSTNGLVVHGFDEVAPHIGDFIRHGDFLIAGGTINTPFLTLLGPYSRFTQSGGTIQVSGEVPIFGSYSLSGGEITTTYTGIAKGASFTQSGGAHTVQRVLSVTGNYDLSGGRLSASGIWMHGRLWIASPASITSPGLLDFGGDLAIATQASLGQFKLSDNGAIQFADSPAILHLQASSDILWNSNSILTISNWNGLPTGGGANQLKFGTDESGLTPAQLNQIWFRINTNLYSAKILKTGEVVPDQMVPPPLVFSRQGDKLVLAWLPGYSLQTATNLAGPYVNVPGTSSPPYTNDMALDSQRFFRLAQ